MSTHEDVHDRQERAARNQCLFREVNERVKDVNDRFHAYTDLSDWVCECANDTCVERIEVAGQDYEHIRAAGNRFVVATADEHVWPDVERVVERHDSYWVVEKIELPAKNAERAEPGSDGPLPMRT